MTDAFRISLARALERRRGLTEDSVTSAFRVFSGIADGMDGVYVDTYGPGAVLIVYEGRPPRWFDEKIEAQTVLEVLKPLGVKAVYLKPFAKDRSRLGGELPPVVTDAAPAAGAALPEAVQIREAKWNLEIRFYDGLSTGLFLDQRENRKFIAQWCTDRLRPVGPPAVLNTFAYTCAFSIAATIGGAVTTSVDVSGRYLEWGKRNFVHNSFDVAAHRFVKMDTFEYFAYARRKALKYDLIILDPPSFASGSKKKGISAWSSIADYGRLVKEAASLLRPRGMIFASTNTAELCKPGRFEGDIFKGLGKMPKWVTLPDAPIDFAREEERFSARAWTM